jgi:hypothetical protein
MIVEETIRDTQKDWSKYWVKILPYINESKSRLHKLVFWSRCEVAMGVNVTVTLPLF